MTYSAPLADIRFALREVAGLAGVSALPGYEHATDDTVDAVLEEAAKLATPEAVRVALPGAIIKTPAELDQWLTGVREQVEEKLKDGPVIL